MFLYILCFFLNVLQFFISCFDPVAKIGFVTFKIGKLKFYMLRLIQANNKNTFLGSKTI